MTAISHDTAAINRTLMQNYFWLLASRMEKEEGFLEKGTTFTSILKDCFEFINKVPVYDTKSQVTNQVSMKHHDRLEETS